MQRVYTIKIYENVSASDISLAYIFIFSINESIAYVAPRWYESEISADC